MDNRISAGELRQMGMAVPENIPDCATVPRDSMVVRQKEMPEISVTGVLSISLEVSFYEPFQWVEATVIIDKPAAEPATDKEE